MRDVFARGNRAILVDGPCAELADEAAAVFAGFWESAEYAERPPG